MLIATSKLWLQNDGVKGELSMHFTIFREGVNNQYLQGVLAYMNFTTVILVKNCIKSNKDWSETKSTTQSVGHFSIVSGHFFCQLH